MRTITRLSSIFGAVLFLQGCFSAPVQWSGLGLSNRSASSQGSIVLTTPFPSTASSGIAFNPSPAIEILDSSGQLNTGFTAPSVSFIAYTDSGCTMPASGTFIANSSSIEAGTATFPGLALIGSGTFYFGMQVGGYSLCSTPVSISSPYKLVFTTQPSSTANSGVALLTRPVVSVENGSNIVVTEPGLITLSLYSNSACTSAAAGSSSNNTQNLASGVASFPGYTIQTAGTYYIGASGGGYTSACSSIVTVVPPLAITPTTATVALGGSLAFTASGGFPPYTFTVVSGGAGGTISGSGSTRTYVASHSIPVLPYDTVQVTDSFSYTADANVTIGAEAMTAGAAHTCSLATGGVQCWGDNSYGQLGNGSTVASSVPVPVTGLTSGVIAIAAGDYHTCALLSTGIVKCWGNNGNGQLGIGSTGGLISSPMTVSGLSGVQAIGVGEYHSCAIVGGSAQCWGWNSTGELGNNSTVDSNIPVQVQGLTSGVIAITGGAGHSCAIRFGAAMCWGNNAYGQLGNNSVIQSLTPVSVVSLATGVQTIVSSYDHTCAINGSGAAQCWGLNSNGQLGNDSTANSLVPVQVQGLTSGVQAIATGQGHSCAMNSVGAAQCWGLNTSGQLGDNTNTSTLVPVSVLGLGSSPTTILTAGYNHSCAFSNNAFSCWGANGSGQLGDGTTMGSELPVTVSP